MADEEESVLGGVVALAKHPEMRSNGNGRLQLRQLAQETWVLAENLTKADTPWRDALQRLHTVERALYEYQQKPWPASVTAECVRLRDLLRTRSIAPLVDEATALLRARRTPAPARESAGPLAS